MKSPESFLPDFCSLQTTFTLVIASLLLAFVLSLADFSAAFGFWSDFGLRSFFIIWIVLFSGATLCVLHSRLVRLSPARGGFATFIVVQAVALAATTIAQKHFGQFGYSDLEGSDFATFELRVLGVSSLVTAAWLRYQYIQARWRLQSRAEVLARLDALQARMHPHFLFNSLNTVAGLIREDPPAAEALLLDMAEVFRAILRKSAKLVPLSEEIDLARQYLNIEQRRLGKRLEIVWNLEGVPEDALIPPLSLQPLVENALRHGIEISREGGKVEISGQYNRAGVVLSVSNTLPEPDAADARPGNREAVANLKARLEACFEDRGRLYTGQADGRYVARIVIPYLTQLP